jgi:hypothetical protein
MFRSYDHLQAYLFIYLGGIRRAHLKAYDSTAEASSFLRGHLAARRRRYQAVKVAHRSELIGLTAEDVSGKRHVDPALFRVLNMGPLYCSACFIQDRCFDKSASRLDKLSLRFVTSNKRRAVYLLIGWIAMCEAITCQHGGANWSCDALRRSTPREVADMTAAASVILATAFRNSECVPQPLWSSGVPGYRARGPGSIPGAVRFSEE